MRCNKSLQRQIWSPLMYKRYVDDINTVSYVPPLGTRYVDGQTIIDESCVTQDEAVDHDRQTMELWQCIQHPSIPFRSRLTSRVII